MSAAPQPVPEQPQAQVQSDPQLREPEVKITLDIDPSRPSSGLRVFYLYCPHCGTVIAKRIEERELTSYRCERCGGIVAYFTHPPSAGRLTIAKERIERIGKK